MLQQCVQSWNSQTTFCVHNKSEYEEKEGLMDKANLKLASYFGRIIFKRALRSDIQKQHPALTVSLEFAIGHFSPLCECVTIRYNATTVFLKSTAIIHEMVYTQQHFLLCLCVWTCIVPLSSLVSISVQGRFFEWLVGDRTLMWWEALRSISYKQRFTTTYHTSPHSTSL